MGIQDITFRPMIWDDAEKLAQLLATPDMNKRQVGEITRSLRSKCRSASNPRYYVAELHHHGHFVALGGVGALCCDNTIQHGLTYRIVDVGLSSHGDPYEVAQALIQELKRVAIHFGASRLLAEVNDPVLEQICQAAGFGALIPTDNTMLVLKNPSLALSA